MFLSLLFQLKLLDRVFSKFQILSSLKYPFEVKYKLLDSKVNKRFSEVTD